MFYYVQGIINFTIYHCYSFTIQYSEVNIFFLDGMLTQDLYRALKNYTMTSQQKQLMYFICPEQILLCVVILNIKYFPLTVAYFQSNNAARHVIQKGNYLIFLYFLLPISLRPSTTCSRPSFNYSFGHQCLNLARF